MSELENAIFQLRIINDFLDVRKRIKDLQALLENEKIEDKLRTYLWIEKGINIPSDYNLWQTMLALEEIGNDYC